MANPDILVFGGSIRTGSFSAKLAALAAKELALLGAEVTLISLGDYPLPIYNADIENGEGFPDNVRKLARLVAGSQGIFIATPEYNYSLPPLLKNAIDWVSRPKITAEFHHRGRIYGIGSTSNGMIGGARALIDLRKVLATALGAMVIADQVSVSLGKDAFDEAGHLVAEPPAKLLRSVCQQLVDLSVRLGPAGA
jgi:NAD(P)H-dependent FMN reductase